MTQTRHIAISALVRSVLVVMLVFISSSQANGSDKSDKKDYVTLRGRIKESVGQTDLLNAYVVLYDSVGSPRDTIRCAGYAPGLGGVNNASFFNIDVERKDSTYVFDVGCDGYTTKTVSYVFDNIGKREIIRNIPTVFLDKAPRELNEIVVTTSKVKFYHKGDTLVFNADAFQLAEGSMLDALIEQLPGVELGSDGQIKVNGKFVETLLLNGRPFIGDNNKLMLENLGAYTVKNIEVYEGQTTIEKWEGSPETHLTMDVKLKKEYNKGWIVNAQAGYGTDSRYMGKLFAGSFGRNLHLSLAANVNNLNDQRQPGKDDKWTPEMLPSDTREYHMASMNYDYLRSDENLWSRGWISFEDNESNGLTSTDRRNFLEGGDTYDRSFSRSKSRNIQLSTSHTVGVIAGMTSVTADVGGSVQNVDNSQRSMSAAFRTEQEDLTMEAIEAIYSDGSPEQLASIINRAITHSDGETKDLRANLSASVARKLNNSGDRLSYRIRMTYDKRGNERWRDYNINFGSDPVPAKLQRRYDDNSPNHTFVMHNDFLFMPKISRTVYLSLAYGYHFTDRVRDSYSYALDRLSDVGVYGVLPDDFVAAFDPGNSYASRQIDNSHQVSAFFSFKKVFADKSSLRINSNLKVELKHTHYDYLQDDIVYPLRRTNLLFGSGYMDFDVRYSCGRYEIAPEQYDNRDEFAYSFSLTPQTPSPSNMIDVANDSDPLNVTVGNPDLKVQYTQSHELSWTRMISSYANNVLSLHCDAEHNAIAHGYDYDTSTGVRRFKTYNVNGNYNCGASNYFMTSFGSRRQFFVNSQTDVKYMKYNDMVRVDDGSMQKSSVGTRVIGQKVTLSWDFHGQSLRLRGDFTNRHSASDQTAYGIVDANHINYGISGVFKLPAGLGISTDFMLYTRSGYGSPELDTTDAIWNMRLSYAPRKAKHWIIYLDGFDMLHQLSNVNYSVSATGRTVTYTNVLPRYTMLTVQYRLNIEPRKR